MTDASLTYRTRYEKNLKAMACRLEDYVATLINERGLSRIDRVSARAKDPVRFSKKAAKTDEFGELKYSDPLEEIQDQIGLRIIVFYLSDVKTVEEEIIGKFFHPIEQKTVSPNDVWKFSYFGRHFILQLPDEAFLESDDRDSLPFCFELQIKTLFQHAWSEAEHDLAYKTTLGELSDEHLRQLAFTSAQAWGADKIFDDLFRGLEGASRELSSAHPQK